MRIRPAFGGPAMRWLLIAFVCTGCDATFDYTEVSDSSSDTSTDETDGDVVALCTGDDTCPKIPPPSTRQLHCDATSGRCFECVKDEQCFGLDHCDPDTHVCVRCNVDTDCDVDFDEVCRAHNCVHPHPCDALHPCDKLGEHCSLGVCVVCESDLQCMSKPPTLDGGLKPQPPHCVTALGRCFPCARDTDCPTTRPACHPQLHECFQCLDGSRCPSKVCDPETHFCVP